MTEKRMVVTQRDVQARLVPVGTPITIPADSFITLTQSLGGNYTVVHQGNMARIDGLDGDAIGMEPQVWSLLPALMGSRMKLIYGRHWRPSTTRKFRSISSILG